MFGKDVFSFANTCGIHVTARLGTHVMRRDSTFRDKSSSSVARASSRKAKRTLREYFSPCSVRTSVLAFLCTSGTPTLYSMFFMCSETVECEVPSSFAAARMLPRRATTSNALRLFSGGNFNGYSCLNINQNIVCTCIKRMQTSSEYRSV